LPYALAAQYFSLGADPASVRWNMVKTEHFSVIYPDNMDSIGNRVANSLEYFRNPASNSLEALPGRWPVILHSRTVISNATTPYAPKRIDIMTMPPQDNYGQNWLDQLVIHEYRHSVQYAAVNRGFTKAMTYIFGQQAVPAVMGLFVPFWFIEGDATVVETATTQTGRGRVPSFEMKLRAQFVEKGIFSYDKAYNGSYRDFIPNWYELGYLLAGHTRLKYGKETWSSVMDRTGKLPFMLVAFSNTLFKETGYGKSRLYDTISSELRQSWLEQDQKTDTTAYTTMLQGKDRLYTSRTQPSMMPDGRIAAIRSSIDDISRIIAIDSKGSEEVLVSPGYIIDDCISAAAGKICWAEMDRDPRWDLQSFSVIKQYDLETGKTIRLTQKTRYFAPCLNSEGSLIAAVEVNETNNNFLVILDAKTGQVIHRHATPENHFASYPAWSPDNGKVAVILTRSEGKCVAVAEISTGKFEIILAFSNVEISKPVFHGEYILFTAGFSGTDNIFAIDQQTRKLYQVTSARFGATDATISPDGKKICYSNYTSNGYKIVYQNLEPGTWNPEPWNNSPFPLANALSEQEGFTFNASEVPDSAYTVKRYRRGLNLFNLHSWAPVALDIDHTDANPGVTLLSQNLLSTSFTTLGYEYSLNEKTGRYYLKYSYEGWYPALDLDVDYGLRRGMYRDSIYYDFDELNLGAWARVPLNWDVKSWFVGFQPYAGYSYKLRTMNPDMELRFREDRFHSLNTKLFFYAQSRMSERDLYPRWGQWVDLNYRQTLFDADTASSVFSAELNLYFPGFFKHHSFRLYGGYQDRVTYYYPYSDQILMPRGYSSLYPGKMFSGAAGYALPLLYPDLNIGPVIYLKQINAGFFCDYAVNFDKTPYTNYLSTGLDLTFDFHLFRWFAPLTAGLRTIYLPWDRQFVFEFLYSVDLSY